MWDACFNGSQSTPSGESKFVTTSTKIVDALWIYFGPVILLVGITGNVLIVFVMTRERMRDTSTSAFMILMAVADVLTLLVGLFVDWLSSLRVSVFGSDPRFSCTAEAFLKYTIGDVATWIKVLFTLNRFVAICFPLKKPIVCSPSSVKYQASAVVAAAVCKNLHVFWTRELLVGVEGRKEKCNDTKEVDRDSGSASFDSSTLISICGYPNPESAYFEMYVRPVIALVTVGVLPFCIVLFCNIFIIRAMLKMYRTRRQHDMIHQTFSPPTRLPTNLPDGGHVPRGIYVSPRLFDPQHHHVSRPCLLGRRWVERDLQKCENRQQSNLLHQLQR